MSCERRERLPELALSAMPLAEARTLGEHAAACPECRAELAALRATVDSFVAWPTDVLRPSTSLWGRLAQRIASETGGEPVPEPRPRPVPGWVEVAPGISCQVLATDHERELVSMLVRLAPGTDYPPHTHAGLEELHVLDGELWIDERRLWAGDFNRAEKGTSDTRVWSETGCTCLLVTSTQDALL